jgi:hypothetical protein
MGGPVERHLHEVHTGFSPLPTAGYNGQLQCGVALHQIAD